VRLPGGPIVGKVRDRATVEGSGGTGEYFTSARIIEGAARELGKGFEIERRVSGATQRRAGKVPKPTADSSAAVSWKDVDNIDLDAPGNVLLTRWTTADETHHLVRDRSDQVESASSAQGPRPSLGTSIEVRRRPFARERRQRIVSRRDVNASNSLGVGLTSVTDDCSIDDQCSHPGYPVCPVIVERPETTLPVEQTAEAKRPGHDARRRMTPAESKLPPSTSARASLCKA